MPKPNEYYVPRKMPNKKWQMEKQIERIESLQAENKKLLEKNKVAHEIIVERVAQLNKMEQENKKLKQFNQSLDSTDRMGTIEKLETENKKLKQINEAWKENLKNLEAHIKCYEEQEKPDFSERLFLELDKIIVNSKFNEKNKDKLLAYATSIAVIFNSKNSIDSNCAWKNIERADTLQEKLNSFEKDLPKILTEFFLMCLENISDYAPNKRIQKNSKKKMLKIAEEFLKKREQK